MCDEFGAVGPEVHAISEISFVVERSVGTQDWIRRNVNQFIRKTTPVRPHSEQNALSSGLPIFRMACIATRHWCHHDHSPTLRTLVAPEPDDAGIR